MKRRIFRGLVTALSLLIAPATFAATSIGVNFQGRDGTQASPYPGTPPLASTDVAGVVPQANWNNIDDANAFTPAEVGTTGPLVDSTGAATPVTLTFAANDSWYNDVDPTNIVTANAKLMNGIIKEAGIGNSAIFTFKGVTDGRYDLYVYFDMNGDNTSLDLTDGDSLITYYVTEQHQFRDTNTFVQCLNTNPAGPRDAGNYVKFSGLSTYGRSSLGVSAKYVANADGIGIAGLQLINVGSSAVNTNPVSITGQPASRRVLAGDTNVTVSVSTKGPVFSFQWYKNSSPVSGATNSTYLLPAITAGDNGAAFYAVVSNNVNSVQSSNAVVTVGNLIAVPGAKQEYWTQATLGGTADRAIVEDPAFSTPPDSLLVLQKFETPDEQGSDYINRVTALFKPPVTGNYVFFIASDDDSDLFLSTDSSPVNKQLIAQEVNWCGDRNWTGNDGGTNNFELEQKRSDQWVPDPAAPPPSPPFANGISLTNGSTYYIEAVHHEGGGGDNLAVTYKLKSDPDPAPGDPTRLTRDVLTPYPQVLDGGFITVTNFPSTFTGLQNRTLTLAIGAISGYEGDTSGAGPSPLEYQWLAASSGSSTFTNVPNATGASLITPLLNLSDSGTQFKVALFVPGATTNSSAATLSVTPDTTAPRPVQVTLVKAGFKEVTLTFDELMDKTSAETGANYVFSPGNVAGASASLAADGTTVTVTTGTALTPNVTNVLAITGVKDLAGNAVAPNTTISFIFQPVTYEADILFDGPLAYYRFEDAVGSAVAKNTGSTGGDGAYYTGDESGPGAGDATPSSAKGDPGPRPPTFAGFEAANHSAAFDGVGEWVDTKNQYLQDRGAFTLEYWVAPADRVNQGNRIGIVGQNDAIEYGFITPDTIQIWTPADSLNTAYTNADNEWHHVATIASGTSIKTYYDGVLQGSTSVTTADYGSSIYNVHIGGGGVFDATGNWFNGHIDEVAIFDKAIPAARVAEHFNAGKNGGVLTTSGAVTPPLSSNITLSLARSGNTLTISWTPAGGALESTAVLNGASSVWSDAGTANPATITIGTGNSFYRVKQ